MFAIIVLSLVFGFAIKNKILIQTLAIHTASSILESDLWRPAAMLGSPAKCDKVASTHAGILFQSGQWR